MPPMYWVRVLINWVLSRLLSSYWIVCHWWIRPEAIGNSVAKIAKKIVLQTYWLPNRESVECTDTSWQYRISTVAKYLLCNLCTTPNDKCGKGPYFATTVDNYCRDTWHVLDNKSLPTPHLSGSIIMGNSTSLPAIKVAETKTFDIKMDILNLPIDESVGMEWLTNVSNPENMASPIMEHQKLKRRNDNNYQVWIPSKWLLQRLIHFYRFVIHTLMTFPNQAMFTAAVFLNISKLLGPAQSIALLSCGKNLWNHTGSWDILCHRLKLTDGTTS